MAGVPGQFLTSPLVHQFVAQGLGIYNREYPPFMAGSDTATNRRTIVIPPMRVDIGGIGHYSGEEVALDLNDPASWDTQDPVDYTIEVTRAGLPFFIFACRPACGRVPVFKISASSTTPSGYNTTNSRRIGGFDTLPYVTAPTWAVNTVIALNYVVKPTAPHANKYLYRCTARSGDFRTHDTTEPTWPTTPGETVVDDAITWTCDANACENLESGHPYKLHEMGSIIFNTIWDLIDLPRSVLKRGMAKISLTPWDGVPALWEDVYLASGTGSTATSVFGATIQDTKDWNTFVEYGRLQGKRLLRDAEFQISAVGGGGEETNIAGSADPGVVTFPLDTAGKSMISVYGLIGKKGIMWQWLDEQSYRYDPDGSVQAASQLSTITYVASLEGVPVYLLWNGPVAYLGAAIAADIWITAGSYKFQIKAVADPVAAGGVQVYFRDAATQPLRLYAVSASGQNAIIQSSNPDFSLIVVHHATPATMGVELRYDNVTHNRLEAINTSGQNQSIDLATSPGWSYYDLPTGVGSLYKQGAYGDVKLIAGGSWAHASVAGSRARHAYSWRWASHASFGCRFCAEPA